MTKKEIDLDKKNEVFGVYLSSPFNSQMFTECCHTAICEDEKRCPSCKNLIVGWSAENNHERGKIRWQRAFKK